MAKNWPKPSQQFWRPNSKNPSPLVSQKFPSVTPTKRIIENINHSRSYKPLNEGHFRKTRSEIYKPELFLYIFWRFLWNEIANLGLIHLWIELPININANDRQNKFEIHKLQNVAKMINNLPKMGQDAALLRELFNFKWP